MLAFKYEYGLYGASAAQSINYILNFIILSSKVTFFNCGKIPDGLWTNFIDSTSFKDLGIFIKLGIPSTLLLIGEWWCFESFVLFAGWLSVAEQAACVCLSNFIFCTFMVVSGVSRASSGLVGNAIGGNKPKLGF